MKVRIITRNGPIELEHMYGWQTVGSDPTALVVVPVEQTEKGYGIPLTEVLLWDWQPEPEDLQGGKLNWQEWFKKPPTEGEQTPPTVSGEEGG